MPPKSRFSSALMSRHVNLYNFETHLHPEPIFTRALLQRIAEMCDAITSDPTLQSLSFKDINGIERVVWRSKQSLEGTPFHVMIRYLGYIELSPEYYHYSKVKLSEGGWSLFEQVQLVSHTWTAHVRDCMEQNVAVTPNGNLTALVAEENKHNSLDANLVTVAPKTGNGNGGEKDTADYTKADLVGVEPARDVSGLWEWNGVLDTLRVYNNLPYNGKKAPCIPSPFFLESVPVTIADPNSKEAILDIDRWAVKLNHAKRIWANTLACHHLKESFQHQWSNNSTVQIKKIVCLGLGGLTDPSRMKVVYQHLGAFTIADTLDEAYQTVFPGSKPIEIIAQDPSYRHKERVLYRSLSSRNITFVDDPHGLLAIDANTLVIAICLPISFPFLQIIADMSMEEGGEGAGPAALLFDNDAYNGPFQKHFSLYERCNLRASKMLYRYGRWSYSPKRKKGEEHLSWCKATTWIYDCKLVRR